MCRWDYGGCGINLNKAINKYTSHKSRLISRSRQRVRYEEDIFTGDPTTIRKWFDWADIVNCFNSIQPLFAAKILPSYTWKEIENKNTLKFLQNKNVIVTYVGSSYRGNPESHKRLAEAYGIKRQLVVTPDMIKFGEFEWLPSAIPVDEYLKMKKKHGGIPIVCQTPSNRRRKNTNKIISAISGKKNIELLIVTGVPWKKCMELKSVADIYIGPFKVGYGMSQLEAMAMKIPVITTLGPKNEALVIRAVGYLPHYDCPLDKLSEGIDTLLSDRELYDEYAELGYNYVKEFHDYPVVAEKFISICEELIQAP